jgi:lipopolysaccharide transport protein LptA
VSEVGLPRPAAILAQAPGVAAPAPADRAAKPSGAPTGLLSSDSDQPLSIKADELEAIEMPNGTRQLLFNRSVHVEQGELLVRSDRLEAYYVAGASQPERLVADGNVRVRQGERDLSCGKATYFPAAERLECVGNALLRDGENRVQGERIDFLFKEDRIRVKGGAVVNVAPERKTPAAKAPATPAPAAEGGAPAAPVEQVGARP